MSRFFCEQLDLATKTVEITDKNEIHHLRDVLRLKQGSAMTIFDGKGTEAAGKISLVKKDKVTIQILQKMAANVPAKAHVTLACAIPKKAKFESIIEKCTELGVDEIFPLLTERTEVRFDDKKRAAKALRYRTVCVNAAKQSQRTTVPMIHEPVKFIDFISQLDPAAKVLIPCLMEPRNKLRDILKTAGHDQKIIFLIGPEGDFSPQELKTAKEKGCIPVSLGPNTLKVDTAAISVMAFIKLYAEE